MQKGALWGSARSLIALENICPVDTTRVAFTEDTRDKILSL